MNSPTKRCREAGFALPAALMVLVLLSSLTAVALTTVREERVSTRAIRESAKALYAAEAGANQVVATWDQKKIDKLLSFAGDSADLGWQTLKNGWSFRPVIRRLTAGGGMKLYSVTVSGGGASPTQGHRTVQLLMRAEPTDFNPPGALTLVGGNGGSFTINGQKPFINGNDTAAPSAVIPGSLPDDCPEELAEDKVAVSVDSEAAKGQLDSELRGKEGQIKGQPPKGKEDKPEDGWGSDASTHPGRGNQRAGNTTETGSWDFNNGEDFDYNVDDELIEELVEQLIPEATHLAPGNYGGTFGTPTEPGMWYSKGYLNLSGSGRGYGILIVEGTLRFGGTRDWEGLVIVIGEGQLLLQGAANEIYGSVVVTNTVGGQPSIRLSGNGGMNYSSDALCRVDEQLKVVSGDARPLVEGAWSQALN